MKEKAFDIFSFLIVFLLILTVAILFYEKSSGRSVEVDALLVGAFFASWTTFAYIYAKRKFPRLTEGEG